MGKNELIKQGHKLPSVTKVTFDSVADTFVSASFAKPEGSIILKILVDALFGRLFENWMISSDPQQSNRLNKITLSLQ